MNISVPSRFACLKLEEEEQAVPRPQKNEKKKEKPCTVEKRQPLSTTAKKTNKPITAPRKEKKVKQQQQKQWEDWKKKDQQFVNGNYEQDLESAIMLSKLDYEENKDKYIKIVEMNKKYDKKKKNKAMSLNEFLSENNNKEIIAAIKPAEPEENFFETVETDAKKEINKDKVLELRKRRESVIEEIITSAQYQEKLEVEKKKNEVLEKELSQAKLEICDVKSRNQILCTMLSSGEMKDKAEVLLEVERLNTIKNELTEEVSRLHKLLEQERSKVTPNDNKYKKSKKHA